MAKASVQTNIVFVCHIEIKMSVDWSKRGDLLAACCGTVVSIWEPFSESTPGPVHQETDKTGIVSVQWSPNRRAIIFGSANGVINTSSNGQSFPSSMTPFSAGIQQLRFTSDGRQIFVASGPSIHQLDLKRQAIDNVFTDGSSSLSSFHLTEELLVSSRTDGSVGLRHLKQGSNLGLIWSGGSQTDKAAAPYPCLAIHSPSSEQLLVASNGPSGIRIATLSSSSGAPISSVNLGSSEAKVTGLQFLGQGNFLHVLASSTQEGKVLLYDLRAPTQPSSVLRVSSSQSTDRWSLSCLDFKLGSEIIGVGSTDGRVGLFDLRSTGFKHLGSFPSTSSTLSSKKHPVTQIHWQPPSASSLSTSRRSSLAVAAPLTEPQAPSPPQEAARVEQIKEKALQDTTNTASVKSRPGPKADKENIPSMVPIIKGQKLSAKQPVVPLLSSAEALAPVLQMREEIRALHLEVLRQSHSSSEDMRSLISQVLEGQKRIEERMNKIEARIERQGQKK